MPVAAVFAMTDVRELGDGATLYTGNASVTNTYEYGYCTFWSAKRREETAKPIPNTWGDARTWDDGARRDGYVVDQTPTQGAIMQTDAGALGHVAFVEEVLPDGIWKISEMNVKGWNILSSRTFTAAQAGNYKFIH